MVYWTYIFQKGSLKVLWVTFLAETSKDLEIILITIVLSFTNSLSRTSLCFSLKTSFVYSNLFSLTKTVTSLKVTGTIIANIWRHHTIGC